MYFQALGRQTCLGSYKNHMDLALFFSDGSCSMVQRRRCYGPSYADLAARSKAPFARVGWCGWRDGRGLRCLAFAAPLHPRATKRRRLATG